MKDYEMLEIMIFYCIYPLAEATVSDQMYPTGGGLFRVSLGPVLPTQCHSRRVSVSPAQCQSACVVPAAQCRSACVVPPAQCQSACVVPPAQCRSACVVLRQSVRACCVSTGTRWRCTVWPRVGSWRPTSPRPAPSAGWSSSAALTPTFCRVRSRVGFVVCREPGRIALYVALPPSRPQPIGSRKQLEPRSRSAVHRDENFVS